MTDERFEAGAEIDEYRIERFIARGGMGEVYEATQVNLDRRVALKLIGTRLSSDDRLRQRFIREAKLAASIEHPNIISVYRSGELPDGRLFLAMRFIDGQDLSSLLREHGPLEPMEAVTILSQIGDALDAAHDRGLIHRDVKPANVMLEQRGQGGWHAYLTDFGLAKPDDDAAEHTASGEVLGTIDYMAPEQIDGRPLDGRADVYSFGCMVYRCLTGALPFKRETRTGTLVAHANAPIPIPSEAVAGLPAPLDIVVARCLEKDPEKRARKAGTLMRWAQLEIEKQATAGTPVTDDSPTEEVRPPRPAPSEAGEVRRRLSYRAAALLHTLAYVPLWVGAYLLGRAL